MYLYGFSVIISQILYVSTFCKHPPGKYCAWGSRRQFDCPKGSYCPENALFFRRCPVGTYLDEYAKADITDCKNCTAGSSCSRTGLDVPNGFCQQGYFCPVGSKTSLEQICPKNYFCPTGSSKAMPCLEGKVQPNLGSWFCHDCPSNAILNFSYVPKLGNAFNSIKLQCFIDCKGYSHLNISYYVVLKSTFGNSSMTLKNFTGSNCHNVTRELFLNVSGIYRFMCSVYSECGRSDRFLEVKILTKVDTVEKKSFVTWYILGGVCLFIFVCVALAYYAINKLGSTVNEGSPVLHLKAADPDNNLVSVEKSMVKPESNSRVTAEQLQKCSAEKHNEYDVFICYSAMDRLWVRNTLLPALENHGLKVCIDFRDFLVGVYIIENITTAIFSSQKTLAVLSPDFVTSIYCKTELSQALSRLDEHQVIPILYKPCEVPDVLSHVTYLDWCHPDIQPHFWDILLKSIRKEE